MHKYLTLAKNLAVNHEYDHNIEFKLCAVLVRGGNVISVGFNQRKTNAFVEHYTDRVRGSGRNFFISTHAEMHAVLQARAKTDLRGSKIFVVRIRPEGSHLGQMLGHARPCAICQDVLFAYGIKRAYYSIDDDTYGVMKLKNQDITDTVFQSCYEEQL